MHKNNLRFKVPLWDNPKHIICLVSKKMEPFFTYSHWNPNFQDTSSLRGDSRVTAPEIYEFF